MSALTHPMGNWRIPFLVVSIAAVLALAALIATPQEGHDSGAARGAPHYSIGKFAAGDYGGENYVFARLAASNAPENATAAAFVSAKEPPSTIEWWEGKSAGAGRAAQLKKSLGEKVSGFGWQIGNYSGFGGKSPRYVIVPAGAWPVELLDALAANGTDMDGQVYIYFGVMDGSAMGAGGRVVKYPGWPAWLSAEGRQIGGGALRGAYRIKMQNGGETWIVPHAPDEITDMDGAAVELAEAMAEAPQIEKSWEKVAIVDGKNPVLLETGQNRGFVRVKILEGGKIVKIFDDGPVVMPLGALEGPAEAANGVAAPFQVRIYSDLVQDEKLVFHAGVYDGQGRLESRMKIGEGSTRGRWVGAFSYSGWNGSGYYTIKIEDQFARVFAKAFVHVPEYSVKEMWSAGAERKYMLLKDGVPAGEEKIAVWKDNSTDVQNFTLSGGAVVVASRWEEGPHTLHFRIGPSVADYGFNEGGGALSVYVKYGLPGAALAAIVFILLRPAARPVYKIRTGNLASPKPHDVKMGWKEFSGVFRNAAKMRGAGRGALTAHEIQEALLSKKAGGAGIAVSEENLQSVLDGLAKSRKISSFRGYYALAEAGDVKGMRMLALSRELSDHMIENGIGTEQKSPSLWIEKGPPRREWMVYSHGADVMSRMKNSRIIVFADEKEKAGFLAGAKSGKNLHSRLWLAMHEGKLALCTIDKIRF